MTFCGHVTLMNDHMTVSLMMAAAGSLLTENVAFGGPEV